MSGLTCSAAVADYDGETALANAKADITNWMKYLRDDMFAAHVSIPGSHDSATGHNVSLPTLSMAQEVLLEDQLKGESVLSTSAPDSTQKPRQLTAKR